jgi:hypothetical protein
VRREFRAIEKTSTLEEFWRDNHLTITVQLDPETRAEIAYLVRREREREQLDRADDDALLTDLLMEDAEDAA